MTRTVIARTTASSGEPSSAHTTAVTTAAPSANQNSHPAARSAMRWALEEEFCASETSFWIPASAVSSPILVISTRRPESVAIVPATTLSPLSRRTVLDSPVIIDSSIEAEPSTILPSAGTEAPGRTTTTSPTSKSAGATGTTSSPSTRSASSGKSAARLSRAELVWARERISSQCPSSMMTINKANSHQKSSWWSRRCRLAPQEARNATVIASPIRSIIPGLRDLISSMAPLRKGKPPQKYMTVPRIGETH